MDDALNSAMGWALQGEAVAAKGPGLQDMLLPLGVLFFLFYIIVLRPQRSEQRKRESMIDELGKGDQVVTIGGIHGTVESYDKPNGVITLAVAPKVSMKFNRSAVSTVVNKKGGKAREEEKDPKSN